MHNILVVIGLLVLVGCQPWQDDLSRNSMQLQDLETRVRMLESLVENLSTNLGDRRANADSFVVMEIPTAELVKMYKNNDEAFNQAFRKYLDKQN
jgi:hypothetical protein